MKNKSLMTFVLILSFGMLSSCSDFRKAVGKEKVIPDEFSIAETPSLLIPPGYKIDPLSLKNSDTDKTNNNFNLNSYSKLLRAYEKLLPDAKLFP